MSVAAGRVEVELATVEQGGGDAETGVAAEAARAALDGHELAVDALGLAVADRMQAVGDDRLQLLLDQQREVEHRAG